MSAMSDFEQSFDAAMAAASDGDLYSSKGYYFTKPIDDGSYVIYAVDPYAKQLFWSWADGNSHMHLYGQNVKGTRRPDLTRTNSGVGRKTSPNTGSTSTRINANAKTR